MSKIVLTEHQLNILEASVKKDERIKLYQDEHILVVVPLSFQASCKYGANTAWCTSTPSSSNSYNTYSDNGIFFYFIIKSPYQNTKVKEYKFAYYHSFNDTFGGGRTGWYDMGDYFYQEEPGDNADIKLIEFLIPEFIFEKVSEYIESQRNVFEEKKQENVVQLFNKILNDNENKIITQDDKFFIFYRNEEYPTNYDEYGNIQLQTLSKTFGFTFFYADLINKKIYRQTLQYIYDIRNIEDLDGEYIKIFNMSHNSGLPVPNLNEIFLKYKKVIIPYYFNQRLNNYKGYKIILKFKYVTVGDETYGKTIKKILHNDTYEFIDENGNQINYDRNDDVLFLTYDKEKHNQ